ncbi:unnamed protein product [Phaeothamnion confervicola]
MVEDAKPKYLAWYDADDEKVEPGPHFQEVVAHPTPWSLRVRSFYGDDRERMNFRLMRDVGDKPATDTPWLYIVHTDIPDDIVRQRAFAAAGNGAGRSARAAICCRRRQSQIPDRVRTDR